jgi:hypothetical protein
MGAIATFGILQVGAERSLVIGRLYFIPFEVTTFVPVTPGNIEEAATFEINLVGPEGNGGPHPFVMSLRAMIKARAAKAQLNDLAVRLKLVLEDETYYVDAAGGVLEMSSKRTFRLQRTELRRIEKSIEGFSGVVDMKAFSRAHGDLRNPR